MVVFILSAKSPSLADVSNSSGRQIEDRHTSSAPPSGSRHHARGKAKTGVILGLAISSALLTVALVTTFYHGGDSERPTTNTTRPHPAFTNQPTEPSNNTTPPPSPSQPNNPPRAVGREERDPAHAFAANTFSEPYPNLHLDDIVDRVFTTAGSSESRSINDQDG